MAEINKKIDDTGYIAYYGKVKVIVKDGDTVISKRYYKNKGGSNLFKFLVLCLAGDYTGAKGLCPAKIALYHNSDTTAEITKNTLTQCSSLVSNDKTPVVNTKDLTNGYTVTYHFTVPSSKIFTGNTTINQVLLFSSDATSSTASKESAASNYCAYYNIADTDKDTTGYQGIDVSDFSGNINLVIEWALTVKNGN